jgi:hypothetical protein
VEALNIIALSNDIVSHPFEVIDWWIQLKLNLVTFFISEDKFELFDLVVVVFIFIHFNFVTSSITIDGWSLVGDVADLEWLVCTLVS